MNKFEIVAIGNDGQKQKPISLTTEEYTELAGAMQHQEHKAAWERNHTPTKVVLQMNESN